MSDSEELGLRPTPFASRHRARGAIMGEFAGYDMPIHYPEGIVAEHQHVRTAAGLFDVSHMGQAYLMGVHSAAALERLVPGDIVGLPIGKMRYTVLLNARGGIIDDLMVLKLAEDLLFLVVNASRREQDFGLLRRTLPRDVTLEVLGERALLALQGPQAAAVLRPHFPEAVALPFMSGIKFGDGTIITRSGYTGEDGFEISMPPGEDNFPLASALEHTPGVKWIGLGARNSLRLEAGLPLYGHDLDETTSPVEAGLGWVISPRRRMAADFPGAQTLLAQLSDGASRLRVGLKLHDKAIAREKTRIALTGRDIGVVTSGSFAPTVGGSIAMGYVRRDYAAPGTEVQMIIRERTHPAEVVALPFVPHRYVK